MAQYKKPYCSITGKPRGRDRTKTWLFGVAIIAMLSVFGMSRDAAAQTSSGSEQGAESNAQHWFVAFLQFLESLGVDLEALFASLDDDNTNDDSDTDDDGSDGPSPSTPVDPVPPSEVAQLNRASRFLSQATFGANYATISEVAQMGEAAWLEQQFLVEPGYTLPLVNNWIQQYVLPYEEGEFSDQFDEEELEEGEEFDDESELAEFDSDEESFEDDEFEEGSDEEGFDDDEFGEGDEEDADSFDEGDESEESEENEMGDMAFAVECENDESGEDVESEEASEDESEEDSEMEGERDECEILPPFEYQESMADMAWYQQAVNGSDPVRQRVAVALSEIFVISRVPEEIAERTELRASYYDMLLRNSFGNFRDLLMDVTLHPAMGIYLSHANNAKADPSKGTFPDENYAREVMQLFSIGLFELIADGSQKLDSNGQPIPTYNNDDIREFAKIFTGLTFDGPRTEFTNMPEPEEREADFTLPMVMFEDQHEPGAKFLLNGAVVPSGQMGMEDIAAAVDNLFNHPNVGPFIGRQLIQRLVTSNPSPDYVARVSAAFNGDNGNPRGDMTSVVRAILMDEEARQAPELAPEFAGKLREPMIRHLHILRAFNATSNNGAVYGESLVLEDEIGQFLFSAPSVFNFFQPTFAPQGEVRDAGLVAPEFQITTTDSIVAITNMSDFMTFGEEVTFVDPRIPFVDPAYLDLSTEIALAGDAAALVDRLDIVLTYGTLRPETRQLVIDKVQELEDPRQRVYRAIFLLTVSPDYAISL